MIDEMRTEHAEEINLTLPPPRLAEADLTRRADPSTYKKSLRELQEQVREWLNSLNANSKLIGASVLPLL